MGLVEAHAAAVQEILVLEALLHDHIGHGVHEGRVRGGFQGEPLRPQGQGRVVPAGVHHDDGDALVPGLAEVVHGLTVKFRFHRVVAPENDEIAVQPVRQVVAGLGGAVHEVGGLGDAGGGIAVVIVQIPAVQLQKPLGKAAAADHGADAGGVVDIAGADAVGIPDTDPLPGDGVRGLLPGDAFEFPLAPAADPLHGVAEPVLAQKGLVVVHAPDAGGQRHAVPGRFQRVRGELFDFSIPHVGVDDAASAAVVPAHGVDHPAAVCSFHMRHRLVSFLSYDSVSGVFLFSKHFIQERRICRRRYRLLRFQPKTSSATRHSRSGWLEMMQSTPRAIMSRMFSSSFTVQVFTFMPRPWNRSISSGWYCRSV